MRTQDDDLVETTAKEWFIDCLRMDVNMVFYTTQQADGNTCCYFAAFARAPANLQSIARTMYEHMVARQAYIKERRQIGRQ